MKVLFVLFLIPVAMSSQIILDFKENSTTKNWRVVDDVVMGGRSNSEFTLTEEGYGKFSGEVSLENNGGFSSVRYDMETLKVNPENKIKIRLKGDGKNYQFRIKAKRSDYYSYITTFDTTNDWQTIEFIVADLYPTFRGKKLDLPKFDKNTIEEIRFLIGNNKAEKFQLLLESIIVLTTK